MATVHTNAPLEICSSKWLIGKKHPDPNVIEVVEIAARRMKKMSLLRSIRVSVPPYLSDVLLRRGKSQLCWQR